MTRTMMSVALRALACAGPGVIHAQTYPAKPVRMVVPVVKAGGVRAD